ncbi:MAG: aminotransferase class III-fold pyridoxal phosphate-dependent enzyme [Candidatus Micrarchaeota archaeon]|nr:aminotransferase class III-fold pyridoxal phosphate-dependent enzyme [Candidatus Micrarchaeota archaeon]MDE1847423.1 aminotransferase class III-fold pyridoxal phosphate-dependent enzyme [Candidatus Micrarchaeota archaeon]MDE1864082.1 aminotransferase class III-fold pyridoxal phosphate-dependent enzyme [Candidatus Micrarchaeota archaeon]
MKINKRINDIIARDSMAISTTTREHYPFVASHGSGDFVFDISGNKFIDFSTFIGVYTLGVNGNAQIRKAVKEQVDKLMHPAFTDFYSEPPVSFAEKLLTMFPKGFGKVFLSNSGTEANEDAIKLSRLFTKRQYLIAFYNSFHGRTLGSLGLTASKTVQREHFGPFNSVIHTPYPYEYRWKDPKDCATDCIEHIKKYILSKEVSPREVAAIFIEPIQGEGGYIVPPKEFMKELRELATEHQILLVSDEVQSGYMKTGKFLALDNFGVTADIYTMAKALGGGLPMGATIYKKSLGDMPAGSHANTFGGNLVSVAAANASLEYVKRNMLSLQKMVKQKGSYILKRLNQMKEDYEIVGDVRGIGMMIGVELVKSKRTKEPAIMERSKVLETCFREGLLLLPCGVSTIRIIPPITIGQKNLEKGMDVLEDAIKSASS